MNPQWPQKEDRPHQLSSSENLNWPAMLAVYEPGFHDVIPELLVEVLRPFRIRVVNAGSQAEVLSLLATRQVGLFFVAGCGGGPINPTTAHLVKEAGGLPAKWLWLKPAT